MLALKPTTLRGSTIQLEPLNETHKNELYNAAQDETIWTYNSSKALGERFYRWFDKAISTSTHLPFIVRRLSDTKMIGSTRYYDINPENRRLSLGYTWYIPEVWGTPVNPECKFLLLKYAFEDGQVNRVEFAIDARNSRSRAAIKKLGAIEEGVLRQHIILEDGFIRDTVIFSIIQSDWPQVKSTLQSRLS
jgi:RimJ/RimL family protein N-acetyltransferase